MPKILSQKNQALELILRYWNHYEGEDKFFIYNPYADKFILGAKQIQDYTNPPFTLYAMDFFGQAENCGKVFKHYCVIENNKIIFNTFDNGNKNNIDTLSIDALIQNFNCIDEGDTPNTSLFEIKQHNTIRHDDSYAEWEKLFFNIQEKIVAQEFEKVVVARKINFECVHGFDFISILLNLFRLNINSYIFAYEQKREIFFGASPELLIEKSPNQMKSFALAGTIKKSEADVFVQGQEFLCDTKNIYEHKIVMNSIIQSMQKLGKNIHIGESHILELKNLLHIKTDICAEEFDMNEHDNKSAMAKDAPKNKSILNWVNELHPTPALGGSPKGSALKFIKKYEPFTRRHFGAPFGIVDENGHGFFIVGIRSATIKGNLLSAYAGCGIVSQSDCAQEFDEIDTKLQTIIEAL